MMKDSIAHSHKSRENKSCKYIFRRVHNSEKKPFTELTFHRDHPIVLHILQEAGPTHQVLKLTNQSDCVFCSTDVSLWRSRSTHHSPTVISVRDGAIVPRQAIGCQVLLFLLLRRQQIPCSELSLILCPTDPVPEITQTSPNDGTRQNFSLM